MNPIRPILIGATLLLSSCAFGPAPFEFPELPVYEVVDSAVSLESARRFAASLGVTSDRLVDDNIIRYLNEERFGALPMRELGAGPLDEDGNATVARGFDFDAIREIEAYPAEEALERVRAALEVAGLVPEAGSAVVEHGRFEAVDRDGGEVADVRLDTQVVFELTAPNGVRLYGPGAEVKVVFDPDGVVTQIAYSLCRLREGERVGVQSDARTRAEAQRLAAARFLGVTPQEITLQGDCSASRVGTLCLESEVVYYAPPPQQRVELILPHYLFHGTFFVEDRAVPVRKLLVPVQAVGVEVELDVTSEGATVRADAAVRGGTPPFRTTWVSSTTDLSAEAQGEAGASPSLVYRPQPRTATDRETLTLVVTDANDLSGWASEAVRITPEAPPLRSRVTRFQATGGPSVGSQWIGPSQGLLGSPRNVAGLVQVLERNGVPLAFNFGEAAAEKRDFVDPHFGGEDHRGVDAVDLLFYTGHATGSGWTFESANPGRFLFFGEARWGNEDLEWLVIAACGPLQDSSGGLAWWQRWGGAFDGLHLLLGYAGITFDNPYEGGLLATHLLERGLPLRQAWAATATETQSPDEIWAVMGVWGEEGVNTYDDHFWGMGPVGPDIPAEEVRGAWRLTGPS